jgi:hypothetical protein
MLCSVTAKHGKNIRWLKNAITTKYWESPGLLH